MKQTKSEMDDPDAPDPPEPSPKAKGVFKGKRKKRALAYKAKKGSKNQKSSRPPSRAPVEEDTLLQQAPREASIPAVISQAQPSYPASKSYKYMTKAELQSLLTECERELAASRAEIARRDKTINSLTTKNNKLIEVTYSSRSVAREAKQFAKSVEDDASRSVKKLREEVAAADEQKKTELKESDARWKEEMERLKKVEQVSLYCFITSKHLQYHSLKYYSFVSPVCRIAANVQSMSRRRRWLVN